MSSAGTPTRGHALRAIAALAALGLTACATSPIVTWTPAPRPQGSEASVLERGYDHADRAQQAYRQALVGQLQASNQLSNGLVATGALIAALAIGNVHRDAIVGVSMLGGTAYVLGTMNLSRPRLLVYQSGIEAMICAKRAVEPFDMTASMLQKLDDAIATLEAQRPKVDERRREVVRLLQPLVDGGQEETDDATMAKDALARVASVQKAADDALVAGRALSGNVRRANNALMLAVDRIDAAVVRATLETVPDLSAVPKAIAGLAGTFDQLAPGAGIGDATGAALKAVFPAKSMSAAPDNKAGPGPSKLVLAVRALLSEADALASATVTVRSLVGDRTASLAPDAFKDCGVASVVTALKTAPASLAFAAGQDATRSLIITGGTKPYLVELDGTPVAGVTVKQPLPFESRAEVSVTKDAKSPQTLLLRVMDSSSPTRIQEVTVSVGEAPAAPGTSGTTTGGDTPGGQSMSLAAGGTGRAPTASQVRDAINALGGRPVRGLPQGMKVRAPARVETGNVRVALSCPSGAAGGSRLQAASVESTLLAAAGVPPGTRLNFRVILEDTPIGACLQ